MKSRGVATSRGVEEVPKGGGVVEEKWKIREAATGGVVAELAQMNRPHEEE